MVLSKFIPPKDCHAFKTFRTKILSSSNMPTLRLSDYSRETLTINVSFFFLKKCDVGNCIRMVHSSSYGCV